MIEVWIFAVVLSFGGMQFSDTYHSLAECDIARLAVLATGHFNGHEVAFVKKCEKIQ